MSSGQTFVIAGARNSAAAHEGLRAPVDGRLLLLGPDVPLAELAADVSPARGATK